MTVEHLPKRKAVHFVPYGSYTAPCGYNVTGDPERTTENRAEVTCAWCQARMTDLGDLPPSVNDGEADEVDGYVAPDARSLYIKSNGKWVEFIAKSEALLYLRFKDYGAQGEDVVFVTLDRQRAFEIQDDDDISDYDHLHIWSGEQVVQKWYWHYEGRWEVEWTDERAQKAGTEEADAESGSTEAEAHPEQ